MKIKSKNKQGISLIVLVITIIVMIILAAAIILSLSSNGLIDRANEAVTKTDRAQVQTLAQTIWADAYLSGARTDKELYDAVREGLKKNNINPDMYTIEISSSGIGEVTDAIWVQEGTVVKNTVTGDTIPAASYVDYVATGSDYVEETDTWQVLGAENGELLIVSSTDVKQWTLGADGYLPNGEDESVKNFRDSQQDYITGVQQLNEECENYGNGAKSSGVRSITSEDIYKLAGYYKTTFKGTDWTDMGLGEVSDYGREVTFYWNGSEYPSYKYEGMETGVKLEGSHDVFVWYDVKSKSWKEAKNPGDKVAEGTEIPIKSSDGTVAKITNNMSGFIGADKFAEGSPIYNMLIGNDTGTYMYWLASPVAFVHPSYGLFCLGVVVEGTAIGGNLVHSNGFSPAAPLGVRAVVSLESDIILKEDVKDSGYWKIQNIEVEP